MIHLLLGWFLQVDDRPKTPVSIFFGFSGEFDFNVPNEEMSAITHRIIQGEQALQMYQCQMQPYQYQMGNLQTQAQIQQFRLMSQRGHVTDTQRSCQTGQCRNLRIELTPVDDPDLDRH